MRSATRSASRQNRGSRQRCTRPFRSRPHLHRGAGGTNRQRVFRRFASRLGPRGRRAWKLRQTYSRRPQHHWLIFLGHALDGGAFPACPAGACLLRGTLEERSALLQKMRSEEHTSELQSHSDLVCRLLLEKKKK